MNEYKSIIPSKIQPAYQRCTTFLGQGPQCITFSALEGRRQSYELNYRESSIKKPKEIIKLALLLCGLIRLPSELFQIVISCKPYCQTVQRSLNSFI